MDKLDSQKAARVWQRVKSDAPVSLREEGLPELIAGEWTAASVYSQLAEKLRGKQSALLRQMAQQEQAHCACLKGIYTMVTGKKPEVKAVIPSAEQPFAALRRCYGQKLKHITRYEERSTDPEYGQVFAGLARQERELCGQLLEVLGELK